MKYYSNNGFSLIELILVIAILGILSSIAVPAYSRLNDEYILNITAMELAQELRYAQQIAFNEKVNIIFDLNIDDNRYEIRTDTTPYKKYKSGEFNKQIDIKTTLNQRYWGDYKGSRLIHYASSGIPSTPCTITLYNKSGGEMTITIALATGRVRIKK